MWQVVSHGTAEKLVRAVGKKLQGNQTQKGMLEDTYSGESLMQKGLPYSLGQVKKSRDEEN